jgi:hypothetical protein
MRNSRLYLYHSLRRVATQQPSTGLLKIKGWKANEYQVEKK